jgi:hypothetical protein
VAVLEELLDVVHRDEGGGGGRDDDDGVHACASEGEIKRKTRAAHACEVRSRRARERWRPTCSTC